MPELSDASHIIQLVIALLMLITAIVAAYVAWRAPQSAAEMAEQMRQAYQAEADRQRLRQYIFSTLMQERASIYSVDATRALNLIDVVYHDCKKVREAWAELLLAYDKSRNVPAHAREERLRKLLVEMAQVLGLGHELRGDDLGRVYYPDAIADEDEITYLRRQNELRHLRGLATTNPPRRSDEPVGSKWPPRPT